MVSNEIFYANSRARVQRGDILIASTGFVSMGKVDIFESDKLFLVDGHISIVCLTNDYDPYFVLYYLRSAFGQLQVEKWWTGSSGQIELTIQDLSKFLIVSKESIPLRNQTSIANKVKEQILYAQSVEIKAEAIRQKAKSIFELSVLGSFATTLN